MNHEKLNDLDNDDQDTIEQNLSDEEINFNDYLDDENPIETNKLSLPKEQATISKPVIKSSRVINLNNVQKLETINESINTSIHPTIKKATLNTNKMESKPNPSNRSQMNPAIRNGKILHVSPTRQINKSNIPIKKQPPPASNSQVNPKPVAARSIQTAKSAQSLNNIKPVVQPKPRSTALKPHANDRASNMSQLSSAKSSISHISEKLLDNGLPKPFINNDEIKLNEEKEQSKQAKNSIDLESNLKLEINSNKMNLIEKPLSARTISSAASNEQRHGSAVSNKPQQQEIQPSAPSISVLFENLPNPFPNANIQPIISKSKHPIESSSSSRLRSFYKKTNRKESPKVNTKMTANSNNNNNKANAKKPTKEDSLDNDNPEQKAYSDDYATDSTDDAKDESQLRKKQARVSESLISEIDLTKPQSIDTSNLNVKLKKFIESYEAINEKYNSYIEEQRNKNVVNEQEIIENRIKYENELASQLKSINFDEITIDSSLQEKMKKMILNDLNNNGSSSSNQRSEQIRSLLREGSSTSIKSQPNPVTEFKRENSITIGSIKSNSNIREIYSIVNSTNNNNNSNSKVEDKDKFNSCNLEKLNDELELTIPKGKKSLGGKAIKPLPFEISQKLDSVVWPMLNNNFDDPSKSSYAYNDVDHYVKQHEYKRDESFNYVSSKLNNNDDFDSFLDNKNFIRANKRNSDSMDSRTLEYLNSLSKARDYETGTNSLNVSDFGIDTENEFRIKWKGK